MINEYLKINWSTLFIGLKKDWISSKQTVRLINDNQSNLNCNDDLLVNFNVYDDEKDVVLNLILENYDVIEKQGIKEWQNSILFSIEASQLSIKEKLEEISSRWAYFDYIEEWRDFSNYSFGGSANSSEEVYEVFFNYLRKLETE